MTSKNKQPVPERRHRPTPFLSRYSFWGRRKKNVREGDISRNYYVDRIGLGYWIAVAIVILLSVVDSVFTLYHVQYGAPVLYSGLQKFLFSNIYFLILKYVLTIVGILALVLHKYFILVRELVIFIILSYGALTAYQVYLFTKLP